MLWRVWKTDTSLIERSSFNAVLCEILILESICSEYVQFVKVLTVGIICIHF